MTVPTVGQAEALAARVVAVVDQDCGCTDPLFECDCGGRWLADRERVASALRAIRRAEEGLREHRQVGAEQFVSSRLWCDTHESFVPAPCRDRIRWQEAHGDAWADLRRTAALYGVTDA
jgi:hypothetical protein